MVLDLRPEKATRDAIVEIVYYIYGNLNRSNSNIHKPVIVKFIDLDNVSSLHSGLFARILNYKFKCQE